jgi:Putative prokaryotic signal transducing protein
MRQLTAGRNILAAKSRRRRAIVIEIMRTNDLVVISAVQAVLDEAGLHVFVADGYISALEGSIGAFQRRVLVIDDEVDAARAAITAAGLGNELRDA